MVSVRTFRFFVGRLQIFIVAVSILCVVVIRVVVDIMNYKAVVGILGIRIYRLILVTVAIFVTATFRIGKTFSKISCFGVKSGAFLRPFISKFFFNLFSTFLKLLG